MASPFDIFPFSIENYRRIVGDQGFTLTDVHEDKAGNTYYVATRNF
jgi:hypothetical protein